MAGWLVQLGFPLYKTELSGEQMNLFECRQILTCLPILLSLSEIIFLLQHMS